MESKIIPRLILTILFILVIGTRRYYERKSATVAKNDLKQDLDAATIIRVQSLLLTVGNLGMIAYLINPTWMAWSSIPIPGWGPWIGTLFGVVGTGLLIEAHRALGDNFFGGVKIREEHQLITSGPYYWVRHPMYTAFILLGFAWFLLSGNWLISGTWLAGTILAIATRLDKEEQMLLSEFGDAYEEYRRQTGALFPKL